VDQVRSAEGEVLYRACEEQEHHHHIVCRRCGYTVEVSGGGAGGGGLVQYTPGTTQATAKPGSGTGPIRPAQSCEASWGPGRVLHEGRELLKEGRGYST